jgi:hypothetical protein
MQGGSTVSQFCVHLLEFGTPRDPRFSGTFARGWWHRSCYSH